MNRRERILTLLSGGQPDRIPWNGDLDWWMRAERDKGTLNPAEDGSVARLKLHRRLGVGFYLQGHFPFYKRIDGVTITTEKNGNDTTVRYETPVGTVYETQRYLPTAFSDAYTHHLLENAKDIPVLKYIWEHTHFEPYYDFCNTLHENLDGYGVVLVYTPRTPFMQLVTCDAGIQNLVFAMMDDPEGFEELFEIMTKKYEEAAAIAIGAPADCVMIPENLSSEVVGKSYYEQYVAPFHRKWTAKIREAGKYSFIHMDGTLQGLLCEVAGNGFDVLEALTPAPVGDMTLEEISKAVAGRCIVWGGIPGGHFTDTVSDADFDEYVKNLLSFYKTHRNFTLGVSDQICPDAREERIARVEQLCEKYGWYE